MTLRTFQGRAPQLGARVFVDPSAVVIGDVTLGDDSSVWPLTVIRGDMHGVAIRIGARTSIQDGSVLHLTHAGPFNPDGYALSIGDEVIVGHKVVLHGCSIGNRVLVGMGAIVMDGAVVEDEVVIGADRLEAWSRLARDLDKRLLAPITRTIGLEEVIPTASELLAGKVRGRVVVDVNR